MKRFEGIIISTGMKNTVVVEIFRKTPHPMYRKLIKRSKKYKVDSAGFEDVIVGSTVKIVETRPISRNKFFKISEIVGAKKVKVVKKEIVEELALDVQDEKSEAVKPVRKTTKPAAAKAGKKESK